MRNLLTTAGVACGILLALCFAALSASHWIIELAEQPLAVIGVAVVGSVCISLLGPSCAFLMRRHGWLLVVPSLIFVSVDCYQNTLGYQTVSGLTVSSEVAGAQTRLDVAQAALDGLPLPSATGEIRQASTWEAVNTALTERRDAAKAELQALKSPATPPLYVALAMAVIQLALTLLFGCLGKPRERESNRRPEPAAPPVREYDPSVISIMDKIAARAQD